MDTLRQTLNRLRAFSHKRQFDHELDAEMASHLELAIEENLRRGLSPEEARRQALIRFGGVEQAKEEHRDARGLTALDSLLEDLRYTFRMLRKNPGFTAVAVTTLALGIGATTAIFSVVNTVLLRPLAYQDAESLTTVWSYNRARGFNTDQVSPLDFADWRSRNHVFESMAASTEAAYTLTGLGDPSLIIAYSFSADYFRVLGVEPLVGRTFLPEEEQPGKNRVAILCYSLWKNRLGGDPRVTGKSITLDGAPYTIVGIMPPGLQYPPFTELWTPLTIAPEAASNRGIRFLRVMARLKPGVTIEHAQREMNTIARRLARDYPKTNKDEDETNIISLRQMISGDIRLALLVLLVAVGCLLLIACANIANLLLARAAARQKEVAVRIALGSSRSRLVRQFLTESIVVGLASGALGLLLTFWGTGALVAMFPPTIFNLSIPHLDRIPIYGWVLGFALSVSLLTGVVFGLIPAFQAGRVNANETLKESGRSLADSAKGRRFRSVLVVVEIAVSMALLAAAGITIKSFVHLLKGDLGFNPENVLTMRVLLPGSKYQTDAQQLAFSNQALDRIKSLPGVTSAGTVTFLPLSGWRGGRGVSLEGDQTPQNQRPMSLWSSVSPDYFRAVGIPLIEGQLFTDRDAQGAPTVAVISKSLARRLIPGENPVGKRLIVDGVKGPVEVVGVVGDVRQLGLTSEMTSQIYLPYAQLPTHIICFAIHTSPDPAGLAKAVQRELWAVDKDQAVGYVMNMSQLSSESLAPQRVLMLVLAAFAGAAMLLAAVGIYGVMSYSVGQRTHEIGIRMAVGADRRDVLKMVLGQGTRLAALGVAIGILGALALTRLMASLLFGVTPTDPATFVAVVLLMVAVVLLACFVPARRATQVDPMVALRHE